MIKADIKSLCEGNKKMAWWAMVLFAEICEVVHNCERDHPDFIKQYAVGKAKEFERLIVMNAVESAKELPSMRERVEALEAKVFGQKEEGVKS